MKPIPPPPKQPHVKRRPNRRHQTLPGPNRVLWIALGLMLAFVVIGFISAIAPALPWVFRGGITRKCLTENCRANPSGPPVEWSKLFGAAREYIGKVDREAVLDDVSATTVASRPEDWDYSQALYVDFRYIGSSGDDLTLRIPDTEPTSVMLISWPADHSSSTIAISRSKQDALVQSLSTLQVGPRDAGELTWEDALGRANTRNISPLILFHLSDTAAVWGVTYRDSDREGELLWNLRYDVDTDTGAVTKSEMPSLPVLREP
ncbi:MAG: hypothetical protein M3441_09640 [Chloroflexota bacterium]|nr:hypothetical protein [Chloroflexota bacterium]